MALLITPDYSEMTNDARKRITALEQFSELGSGFQIAMKDLEIRGAGDLLGGEQSGFINDIGFDTYQKILNEAIDELKENYNGFQRRVTTIKPGRYSIGLGLEKKVCFL